MEHYYILSVKSSRFVLIPISNDNIINYLSENYKAKVKSRQSFIFSFEDTERLNDDLRKTIGSLLEKVRQEVHVPPNYAEVDVLGRAMRLNLRDAIEHKIFWLSNIQNIVGDAVANKGELEFLHLDKDTPDKIKRIRQSQ